MLPGRVHRGRCDPGDPVKSASYFAVSAGQQDEPCGQQPGQQPGQSPAPDLEPALRVSARADNDDTVRMRTANKRNFMDFSSRLRHVDACAPVRRSADGHTGRV